MSKEIRKKCLTKYEAYLYGTVEEFVMFTLIYFNRSQHAIALKRTFKSFPRGKHRVDNTFLFIYLFVFSEFGAW